MMTAQEAQILWQLVKPLKVGMLVTNDLHARPMHLVQSEFTGDFYFFTNRDSLKVHEIADDHKVCLTFSGVQSQTYVSVAGTASIIKDQTLIDQFWNPFVSAWFPQGKEDPTVVLIKIKTLGAEQWHATSNKLVQLYQYAKALVTNEQPKMGEHGVVGIVQK